MLEGRRVRRVRGKVRKMRGDVYIGAEWGGDKWDVLGNKWEDERDKWDRRG